MNDHPEILKYASMKKRQSGNDAFYASNTISSVILLTKVILFACFTYHNIAKALVQKQWHASNAKNVIM